MGIRYYFCDLLGLCRAEFIRLSFGMSHAYKRNKNQLKIELILGLLGLDCWSVDNLYKKLDFKLIFISLIGMWHTKRKPEKFCTT